MDLDRNEETAMLARKMTRRAFVSSIGTVALSALAGCGGSGSESGDDGSEADIELTRCQPSVDDDLEFGTGDTPTVTLNLHPIIYNATRHASDGYPAYSYRLGDYDTTTKKRLNASTGEYA